MIAINFGSWTFFKNENAAGGGSKQQSGLPLKVEKSKMGVGYKIFEILEPI